MLYGVVQNEVNCNSLDFYKQRLEETAESRQVKVLRPWISYNRARYQTSSFYCSVAEGSSC